MARPLDQRQHGAPLARATSSLTLVRRLPHNRAALALMALVTLLCAFSFAALPGFLTQMSDNGLHRGVGDAASFERNIALTQVSALPLRPNGSALTQVGNVGSIDAAGAALQDAMPASVRAIIGARTSVADGPRMIVRSLPGAPTVAFLRYFQLRYQSNLAEQVHLISGRLPVPHEPLALAPGSAPLPVFETALTPETAREMALQVNDRVLVVSDPEYWRETNLVRRPQAYQLIIEVVGIIEANDADADYWMGDPRLLRPAVFETPDVTLVYGTGVLADDAYLPLVQQTTPEPWTYQWRYFVTPGQITEATLGNLLAGLQRLGFLYPSTTRVTTALPELIRQISGQRQIVVTNLALAAAGLAAMTLAVLTSLAALLAGRRRQALVLAQARGASLPQLALAQGVEGLLVALPAALLGALVATTLYPWAGLRVPLLVVAAITFAAVLIFIGAMLVIVCSAGSSRARPGSGRRGAISGRLVAEGFVVVIAFVGLALLRRRGLIGQQASFDPYLVAVPVLLSLATGLVILRLLPLLALLGARIAKGGRGAVAFLSLRRLAQPTAAQLPLLAIVLALTLATFIATLQSSISTAQSTVTWRRVGAAYRIDSVGTDLLAPPALDLSGIPGVAATASATTLLSLQIAPAAVRTTGVTLFALDPGKYAAVVAGTPADPHLPATFRDAPALPTSGQPQVPIPAIISSRWVPITPPRVGGTFGLELNNTEVTFVVVEIRDSFPTLRSEEPFVIAPLPALQASRPQTPLPVTTLFVRAPASAQQALAQAAQRQQPPATLAAQQQDYDRAQRRPFVTGTATGFRWSLGLIFLLTLLAVAATAEQGTRLHTHERAYLRLLGLHSRQSLSLIALEALPPITLAGLAGAALGAGLTRLIGPALDLTVFTGPGQPVALQTDWTLLTLLLILLVGLASVAALISGGVARRLALGQVLRETVR